MVADPDQLLSRLQRPTRRQRLRLGRQQRLIQLPITAHQLIAAQQSVTSMPRQALHQGADFSEIPALHHMQAQIKR